MNQLDADGLEKSTEFFQPKEECLSDCYKNQVHSVLCIHYNQYKKE